MVAECLEKLQVLKLQLGQMRETVKETRGSLLAETLNIDTHVRYDSKRFRFYVGSNPTDVAYSVNGVMAAHLVYWSRRFQAIVHMGRLDGVRNNGGSSNLPWLTNNNIYV
jgi:hypothetical protein